MNSIFLSYSGFQEMVWFVLLIAFTVTIYTWSKSKIANTTIAVILTLVLSYIIFIQYKELVWIVAIVIVLYWIYGDDLKKVLIPKKK